MGQWSGFYTLNFHRRIQATLGEVAEGRVAVRPPALFLVGEVVEAFEPLVERLKTLEVAG